MTTEQIANRLVELCREGKFETAQKELYADNAISIEPAHAQGMQTIEGLTAIIEKGNKFQSMIEAYHGGYVTEPVIGGSHFSVGIGMDVTMTGMGRMNMEEIAVYQVKDGKICKEQFFF